MKAEFQDLKVALTEWFHKTNDRAEDLRHISDNAANRLSRLSIDLEQQVSDIAPNVADEYVWKVQVVQPLRDEIGKFSSSLYGWQHSDQSSTEAKAVIEKMEGLREAIAEANSYDTSDKSAISVRRTVWEKYDGKCVYCDCQLDSPDQSFGGVTMHVDHLVPKCAGGPDSLSNYVPSCGSCNISKNGGDPVAFVLRLRGKQPSQNVIPIESAS
jgi:CRISPR/Cas system Type II protein with McrA/HNH and RuvC-like nuclease domain